MNPIATRRNVKSYFRIHSRDLHYINTLKQELNGTKAYEETSIDEKSVVYSHSNEIPNKFDVDVKERQDRLPNLY